MIDWLEPIIPHLKALHVTALVLWTGGLFALPLMLSRNDRAIGQADFSRIRRATHFSYTLAITPAAVTAIASGLVLIFLREVFVIWMFAKLVFVALLIAFHAWVGGTLVRVAEEEGAHVPPEPLVPLLLLMVPVLVILTLCWPSRTSATSRCLAGRCSREGVTSPSRCPGCSRRRACSPAIRPP